MVDPKVARSLFGTFIVALLAVNCGGSPPPADPAPPVDPSTVLTITVRNDQMDEARVWLWVDGRRERLGDVRGSSAETFYHPMSRTSTVHMEFDLVLGEHCVTADISLGPGDEIRTTIPVNLNMMAAVCRRGLEKEAAYDPARRASGPTPAYPPVDRETVMSVSIPDHRLLST